MTARMRIAALALAAFFAAAPALAAAALACDSCCCHAAPCDDDAAGCETFTTIPCCEAAPPVTPSSAKRTVEAPSVHVFAPARLASVAIVWHPRTSVWRGDLDILISPLRRSVVLRI